MEIVRDHVPPIKDSRDTFSDLGVYKVVCSCGTPYIGETGHSFHTKIKEHVANIRHDRVCKSALAEHSFSTKHHICLEDTQVLAKEDNYFKRKLKEAVEISRHPLNLNRDDGWILNPSWQPMLTSRDRDQHPAS